MSYICIRRGIENLTSIFFILQCALIETSFANKLMQKSQPNTINDVNNTLIKKILLWQAEGTFKHMFGEGEEVFLNNDCPVDKCFVSNDRHLFGEDLRKYDAILFDGSNQNWLIDGDLPEKRHNHQKYIYVQGDSAARSYICHTEFDDFFNWTMTYKLDSDIIFPHIHVRDINGEIVGPKKDMHWVPITPGTEVSYSINKNTKTKAAAWFYSKCEPLGTERKFVESLQKAMNKYGLKIDIYGKCGPLNCPLHACDQILETDYYFYLAIEDSFAEDYVTGNILRALNNNVVPIVYGGANYSRYNSFHSYKLKRAQIEFLLCKVMQTPASERSIDDGLMIVDHVVEQRVSNKRSRYVSTEYDQLLISDRFDYRFLPPESYLDGTLQTPEEIATTINGLIKNQTLYRRYFWWKAHYSFSLGQATPSLPLEGLTYYGLTICSLCQALHDPNKFNVQSSYKDFRKWWYPGYLDRCGKTANISIHTLKRGLKQKQRIKEMNQSKEIEADKIIKAEKEYETEDNISNNNNTNDTLTEEEVFRRQPYSVQRRKMAENNFRKMARRQGLGLLWQFLTGPISGLLGSGGQGGGGGGVVRNGAMVAGEFARIRMSIKSNNFDIYKR